MRRAVVIGAGLAGVLAAAALAPAVDEVVVLDSDELPDGPVHRRGLPQGRHAHLFMTGGLAAMDDLLPGVDIRRLLLDAGAHEIDAARDMVARTTEGWLPRWRHDGPRVLSCSRALVDWVVRDAVLRTTGARIRNARATELLGDAGRVRGVRAWDQDGDTDLAADLVVDASGRGSRIVRWLDVLGVRGVEERSVDTGLVNATRVYRTPAGAERFPLTVIHADPYSGRPGRSGMVMPIEGDRWMVSLGGTRGGEPPSDADGFLRYALELADPVVGRLISGAEPLTDVHLSRSTSNARRYLEKVRDWPEGLVVLGDALATFNPNYGQGMSVAALEAGVLARELAHGDVRATGLARRVQRAAARPVDAAWTIALGQDVWYPQVRGGRPGVADRLVTAFSRRLTKAATGSYPAAAALWDVSTMTTGPERLLRPSTLLAVLNGPLLPPTSTPPLTESEQKIVRSLDRTAL
ncbi:MULTISPECIES: FAD-dependent monooxygenase [unclassified Streptomyces]|uniref:FAD-dependent monooxygenase n=1 Tax=unclassified Streptomyces TaxID=2593676 RepID=UPI003820AB5B